jgi:hypothetical protein
MWLEALRKCSLERRKLRLRLLVFANLTWMSFFERLQSCRPILFQKFEAKAFPSVQLG